MKCDVCGVEMGTDETVDSHQPLPSGKLERGRIAYFTMCPACAKRRHTTANLFLWMLLFIACGLIIAACHSSALTSLVSMNCNAVGFSSIVELGDGDVGQLEYR